MLGLKRELKNRNKKERKSKHALFLLSRKMKNIATHIKKGGQMTPPLDYKSIPQYK
jgi:hypothetical protein